MDPFATSSRRRFHRQMVAWVPGVLAGAADADPTTVAAIAVVGASTVYGLSWLVLLVFPLLAVVQVIASQVGLVSGRDLQTNAVRAFAPSARVALLISVVVVNVVTVTADLEGGAAAIGVLTGAPWRWFVLPLALLVVALLVFGAYRSVQKFLLGALAFLFAYVVSAVLAHVDWGEVARATLHPSLRMNSDWTGGAIAILGTTLTGYVYIWLTIEEAEERSPLSLRRAKATGAWVGILFSVVLFWFILVASGATLGVHHQHIKTVEDAAAALRPLAGSLASDIFAVGLLASAVVALPVIASTSAYVLAAQNGWTRGLTLPVRQAGRFYGALVGGVALGTGLAFIGVSPIRLLYIASVAGGLATPVGLVALLALAGNAQIMNGHCIGRRLRLAGWCVVAVLTAVSGVYLVQLVLG